MTEYVAFREDGTVLNEGEEIIDFRGDKAVFDGVSRGPEYNGTAKILYKEKGPKGWKGECYAGVYKVLVMSREDYVWASQIIEDAKKKDIDLELKNFRHTPDLSINGMDPKEWLEAMTMD